MSERSSVQAADDTGRIRRMTQTPRLFSRRAFLRGGVVASASLATAGFLSRAAAGSADPSAPLADGAVTYDFNQDWLFGGIYVPGAEQPAYPDSRFATVTLPHTVAPLSWGDWDPSTWENVWVYRKHLDSAAVAGGRVFLDFDGVLTSATVFVGGQKVTQHQGGYLPFSVELTEHIAAGDNVIAVVVDSRWQDVPPEGNPAGAASIDYLEPGGIHRDVRVRVVPPVFVSDVFAKPTGVLSGSPAVEVQVTLDAVEVPAHPVQVTTELLDGANVIGSASAQAHITAQGQIAAHTTIGGLGAVTLWSPETPKLYVTRTTVSGHGMPSHTLDVRTGFREARFELDGFYLNGERLQIFGLNRHGLFPYLGMAVPGRLQRRDAEILRGELNCNMVRCSHYPQSPDFLDACDELGLMVWEEAPGWQYVGDDAFKQIVVQNVADMVIRDRNRPSVVVWGTRLDETPSHPKLYAETRFVADALDGTRQTTGAMHAHNTKGWAQDVFAYADYHPSGGAPLEPPVPGVPYLVSEAAGVLDEAPMYRWVDSAQTLAGQAQMHAQVHDIARSNPRYAGLLAWSAVDYASLYGGHKAWSNVKWAGVLDSFRVPKPGAAFYRSQIDPAVRPVILPAFFWDFGPASLPAGPGAGAMIATNCERLELYVDSVHFATATPNRGDFGHLAHPPVLVDLILDGSLQPELRIDGYVSGRLATSVTMSSDPARDVLAVSAEDPAIEADGSDMTRIVFKALDAYGNPRPYVAGEVLLSLSGPGTLIGDNPFAFSVYGSVGGAFLRSQVDRTGPITVTAQHATLGHGSCQVSAVAPSGRFL